MVSNFRISSTDSNVNHLILSAIKYCLVANNDHSSFYLFFDYFYFVGEFCQPLGDLNVWGTLYPIKEPLEEPEVVMLATKVQDINYT